jgi:L-ascorbate metabolism protein UlaG (beta-lactamase superfamily)
MAPDDAARAHHILGAQTSIAIHHGTFQLTDESLDTPRRLLRGSAPDSFLVVNDEQSVTLA